MKSGLLLFFSVLLISCSSNDDSNDTIRTGAPNEENNIVMCLAPTALTASNIQSDSADLSWTNSSSNNVELYDLEYGAPGFSVGSGTVFSINQTNPTITGLLPNTMYEFFVRANCTNNSFSDWAGPKAFTTTN